jgi:hypothetical protein
VCATVKSSLGGRCNEILRLAGSGARRSLSWLRCVCGRSVSDRAWVVVDWSQRGLAPAAVCDRMGRLPGDDAVGEQTPAHRRLGGHGLKLIRRRVIADHRRTEQRRLKALQRLAAAAPQLIEHEDRVDSVGSPTAQASPPHVPCPLHAQLSTRRLPKGSSRRPDPHHPSAVLNRAGHSSPASCSSPAMMVPPSRRRRTTNSRRSASISPCSPRRASEIWCSRLVSSSRRAVI